MAFVEFAAVHLQYETVRIAIAVLAVAIGSYFDIFNNRNIPNWLTYSMLALAILINIPGFEMNAAIYTFGIAAIVFVLGYAFYVNGQIGGADVLVLTSIALLLPVQPTLLLLKGAPAPIIQFPFILTVFITAGILFILIMFLLSAPKALKALGTGKIKFSLMQKLSAALLLVFFCVFAYLANQVDIFPKSFILILAAVLIPSIFFTLFKDFIEDEMTELISVDKIEEEDVLLIRKLDPQLVKEHNLKKLLDAKEIERLKSLPIKKFPIFTRMPAFLPYVLMALLINLLVGDLMLLLAASSMGVRAVA
ncbi:Type IV leader peptidase family protein [Candidatus Gugararchaeum adminiculabundum]|nr:Type IV leader peptidase family protein [Candidatus Gugararchaeum adminiculabundum]